MFMSNPDRWKEKFSLFQNIKIDDPHKQGILLKEKFQIRFLDPPFQINNRHRCRLQQEDNNYYEVPCSVENGVFSITVPENTFDNVNPSSCLTRFKVEVDGVLSPFPIGVRFYKKEKGKTLETKKLKKTQSNYPQPKIVPSITPIIYYISQGLINNRKVRNAQQKTPLDEHKEIKKKFKRKTTSEETNQYEIIIDRPINETLDDSYLVDVTEEDIDRCLSPKDSENHKLALNSSGI